MYNLEELQKLVEDGEIARRPHPTKDIYIYTYLKTFYPEWTETLRWARGLILDSNGNRLACPFKKFFNYSEIKADVDKLIAENVPHRIQEKLDGSLGILFFYDGEWILSTKGSFTSIQSEMATEILHAKYKDELANLNKEYTYLFEIIYPANQIVVSYNYHALVLLAVMNPKTMEEVVGEIDIFWPDTVKHYYNLSISNIIKDMSRPDYCSAEGFIVVFGDGTRVKFKYDEYVRLHKIVSDFRPKNIVEFMSTGGDINEMINTLPDEFKDEIIEVKNKTLSEYADICHETLSIFNRINSSDKKIFALEAIKVEDKKALLFEMWKQFYNGNLKEENLTPYNFTFWVMQTKYLNEMVYDRLLEQCKDWVLLTNYKQHEVAT